MSSPQPITIAECLTLLSSKNKAIMKKVFAITKEVEPSIKRVCRFNSLFFDLNGRLFYSGVQVKDRKKDTLTIGFCQGVSVSKLNPALELVLEGQKEGLRMIRKLKIDTLQDLETFHFKELLGIMVTYNKEHNTHKEFTEKRRNVRKLKQRVK